MPPPTLPSPLYNPYITLTSRKTEGPDRMRCDPLSPHQNLPSLQPIVMDKLATLGLLGIYSPGSSGYGHRGWAKAHLEPTALHSIFRVFSNTPLDRLEVESPLLSWTAGSKGGMGQSSWLPSPLSLLCAWTWKGAPLNGSVVTGEWAGCWYQDGRGAGL